MPTVCCKGVLRTRSSQQAGKEPCTSGLGAHGADLECAGVSEQNKGVVIRRASPRVAAKIDWGYCCKKMGGPVVDKEKIEMGIDFRC